MPFKIAEAVAEQWSEQCDRDHQPERKIELPNQLLIGALAPSPSRKNQRGGRHQISEEEPYRLRKITLLKKPPEIPAVRLLTRLFTGRLLKVASVLRPRDVSPFDRLLNLIDKAFRAVEIKKQYLQEANLPII